MSEGRIPSISMAEAMVDSWMLATISMWYDRLDKEVTLGLIKKTFDWDELWEAAVEVNQLCAARSMSVKIPRNRDLGEQKDRVSVLGSNLIGSLQELKNRADKPIFIVSSANLSQVPGVVKDNVGAEPAVTARLDNIEKMVENLTKGFTEMKAEKAVQWPPLLQVNGSGVQHGHGQGQGLQHGQGHVGATQQGVKSKPDNAHFRARSPSVKRSADQAQLESNQSTEQAETTWSQVVGRNQGRRSRKVQYGTASVSEGTIAAGQAAPYDVVIGNTHPESTDEIIKNVLIKVSEGMSEELKPQRPLEILEIECLTKPRTDGSRIWTKTWRVQVPNMFRDHMMRPEAYPAGWNTRRYFPPRPPRPPVPDLDPTASQPPVKRANLQA